MGRAELAVEGDRTLGGQVERAIRAVDETVLHANLFSRLLIEKVGVAVRTSDGSLQGQGHYAVFYCPVDDTASSVVVGEWVYGEWGDKTIQKPLESGAIVEGSRAILAMGQARKAGNSTEVAGSRLAVGLVEKRGAAGGAVHFGGAVNLDGPRSVTGPLPEVDFYSAVTGFITLRQNRIVPGFYPLRKGGRP